MIDSTKHEKIERAARLHYKDSLGPKVPLNEGDLPSPSQVQGLLNWPRIDGGDAPLTVSSCWCVKYDPGELPRKAAVDGLSSKFRFFVGYECITTLAHEGESEVKLTTEVKAKQVYFSDRPESGWSEVSRQDEAPHFLGDLDEFFSALEEPLSWSVPTHDF